MKAFRIPGVTGPAAPEPEVPAAPPPSIPEPPKVDPAAPIALPELGDTQAYLEKAHALMTANINFQWTSIWIGLAQASAMKEVAWELRKLNDHLTFNAAGGNTLRSYTMTTSATPAPKKRGRPKKVKPMKTDLLPGEKVDFKDKP